MGDNYVVLVPALILAVAAVFIVSNVCVPLESVVVPDARLLKTMINVFPAVSFILVAGLLIKWSSEKKVRRLTYWCAMVITVAALAYVLGIDYLVFVFLLATALGTVIPICTEDPCRQGVWHSVTSPKTLAVFFVLAALISYGAANSEQLRTAVVERIVDVAVFSAGSTAHLFDVNRIIPPGVTPEEKAEIVGELQRSVPNWYQLSDKQRQQLIDQYVQQYISMKDAFRRALEKGLAGMDEDQLRKTMKQQIMELPVAKIFLANVHYVFALMCAMLYSLITIPAELLALLLGMVLKFLIKSTKERRVAG